MCSPGAKCGNEWNEAQGDEPLGSHEPGHCFYGGIKLTEVSEREEVRTCIE